MVNDGKKNSEFGKREYHFINSRNSVRIVNPGKKFLKATHYYWLYSLCWLFGLNKYASFSAIEVQFESLAFLGVLGRFNWKNITIRRKSFKNFLFVLV